MTDTRADFEKHFKLTIRQHDRCPDGTYRDPGIRLRWEGWQARPALQPLDEEMSKILGRPNFSCIRLANSLRLLGQEIPSKAEDEQAAVIYWALTLYLQYGKEWQAMANEALAKLADLQKTA